MVSDLKKQIRKSGKSLYRIATDAGVTPAVVSRFMAGKRDVNLATAAKLAEVLDLELQYETKR
jgi:transcriptional regulator with XRE-family HTH domain